MRTHFETKKLVPCYSEEGRCERCRRMLSLYSMELRRGMWNAFGLREVVLEPVRLKYGKPIRVTRCFVCSRRCKRRGMDEQYATGERADITATHGARRIADGCDEYMRAENVKIGRLIEDTVEFDELVYVNCDELGRPEWLTVSYKRDGGNRHEVTRR
jgi:hypothetical protein